MPRVVLLSRGGRILSDVAAGLAERGITVDAVVLYTYVPPPGAGGAASALVRGGRGVLRRARRWLRARLDPRLRAAAPRVVLTGPLNGRRMTRDLARLRPDVVVLAGCDLLAAHVLEIPPAGVLNVHPGLLPWIRGNSPVANSVSRGVPLGSTSFRVDAGIDTGRILERRLLAVSGRPSTDQLRDALRGLWAAMTVDLVVAAREGAVPPGEVQGGRFPLCRTLSDAREIAAVEAAVRRGAPAALFERWRRYATEGLSLTPDSDVHCVPGPSI